MLAAVYILTNPRHTVLYTGSTTDLNRRMEERLAKPWEFAFTNRYHCTELVWYDVCEDLGSVREMERRIKGWTRAKKIALISSKNPDWKDLRDEIF